MSRVYGTRALNPTIADEVERHKRAAKFAPHWSGIPASRRVASCTYGPRDGSRACSAVSPLRLGGRRMRRLCHSLCQSSVGLAANRLDLMRLHAQYSSANMMVITRLVTEGSAGSGE